ncbi:MAG: sugar ABC transporter substrate-binding protein [Solirubrobacteraceae bacterium]|nr:sugar ABC transporter substrate-binding protein [Solirubrobacteraceae bacterium]
MTRWSITALTARRTVAMAMLATAMALAGCGGSADSSKTEASTTAGSTTEASATTELVKPYDGFEKEYPDSFPTPSKAEGKQFTIGCQNPVGTGNETTTTFCKGVEAQAKALGMGYIGLVDGLDIDKQVTNFNQLLAQNVDAIVLYPLAPDALRASLNKAKSQNVPVVGFDVTFTKDADAPGYLAQVWQGRDHQAYESVAYMAKLAPNGKVGLIGIGAPVPALKYLIERQRFWAEQLGLEVVGEQDNTSDDVAGGSKAMTGLLGRFGDIDGVIGYNDESAVGAYTAARGQGREDVKIIAINGSDLGLTALRAGRISAVVQVDAANQGAQAAVAAYNQLTKQSLPLPNVVLRSPQLITKDNLGSVASWKDQLAAIESGSSAG